MICLVSSISFAILFFTVLHPSSCIVFHTGYFIHCTILTVLCFFLGMWVNWAGLDRLVFLCVFHILVINLLAGIGDMRNFLSHDLSTGIICYDWLLNATRTASWILTTGMVIYSVNNITCHFPPIDNTMGKHFSFFLKLFNQNLHKRDHILHQQLSEVVFGLLVNISKICTCRSCEIYFRVQENK